MLAEDTTQSTVFIANPKWVAEVIKNMKEGGAENLHILADFDSTLTKANVNGKETPSLISILRDGNYLAPDYAEKAHALRDKYHPFEIDPAVSRQKKAEMMEAWWREHVALLVASGLTRGDIEHAAQSGKIHLRARFASCSELLRRRGVPIVIMSSSGLGVDGIVSYLEFHGELSNNISVISNRFVWGENGEALGMIEPIIHGGNKSETVIRDYPEAFKKVEDRKNVVLLGDSLEDVHMVDGFEYDNLLKIGFLNKNVAERLDEYQKKYDVVLAHDTDMSYLENLLNEILV